MRDEVRKETDWDTIDERWAMSFQYAGQDGPPLLVWLQID